MTSLTGPDVKTTATTAIDQTNPITPLRVAIDKTRRPVRPVDALKQVDAMDMPRTETTKLRH